MFLYFYIEESWKYIQSKVFVPSPFFDVCLQRTQILCVGKSKCWKMLFKDMVYDVMYLKRLSLYLCNCIRRDPSYDWKTTFAVCHFQILKKYEVMPKMSGRADRYIGAQWTWSIYFGWDWSTATNFLWILENVPLSGV